MASSGNIKQITLPNGNTYDINAVTVNGHTVETDVPSGAVFTDTTYTAATANPKMDGTVAVGTSTKYAREDHVHPSDTSRVPTSRKVNNKALSADITLAASDVGAIATSAKGAASGVAELDSNGKVPSSQLPSFVDDVLEYNGTSSFPATGEAGKIYVDTSTNKTYRWGGSSYTEISASLALGETSSTAYRGDRGKTAYTHATDSSRLTTATSSGLYKVAATSQGHIASLTAVEKSDITALGIPGSDTNTKYGLSISGHTVSLVEGGTTASVTVPDNNTTYGLSISGHDISLVSGGTTTSVTVPDNNNAVTQTATSTSADYEVLFSSTADNTTRTEGARKNSNLKFNPSTGNLQVTQINGVTVGSSPKFTDNNTTYSAGTGLSLSSTTFNHSNSVTAGTVGTSSATSGSTLAVPYVTYDAQGHVTATGTHTHTVSGFLTSHQTIKQDGVTGATVNRFGTCGTAAATAAKTVSITTGTFSLEAGAIVAVSFTNANTANSPTLNVGSTGAKSIFVNGAQITSGGNKAMLKGTVLFIYDGTQYHLIGNYTDTNTHFTTGLITGASDTATENAAATNGNVYLNVLDNTAVRNSHNIVGTGSVTVASDANGKITINGTDNNTKYGLSISGHTVSLVEGGTTASVTVPDNNDNNAVTQTATSTSADYEVLFSSTADNTTRTEGARKNSNLKFNPSTGNLQVTQINGVTVGSSPKFTDNNTTYGLSISGHTVSLVAGGTTSSVTVPDNNTTYGLSISGHTVSIVSGGTTSSVTVPDDDTWTPMTGATSSANGTVGYVNVVPPKAGYNTKYLRADSTWDVPVIGNNGILIPDNSDLNSYVTPGMYYSPNSTSSKTMSNVPSTGAGFKLYVERGYQTARIYQTFITAGTEAFYRRMTDDTGSTWKAWSIGTRTLAGSATGSETNPVYIAANGMATATTYALNATVPSNAKFTDTTYTANTTSIGSASGWSAGTAASASVANGVLTITNGTKPALTVTSTTVATGITAS